MGAIVGIPYRLVRSDESGAVDKVIYLATRRSGEAGASMKQARRDHSKSEFEAGRAANRYAALDAKVKATDPTQDVYLDLVEKRDKAFDLVRQANERAIEAAEKLVLASLVENYGREKAGEIFDALTERDLGGMVLAIASGEQPEDFFPSRAEPAKSTTISPSADGGCASSSRPDTLPPRLPQEK